MRNFLVNKLVLVLFSLFVNACTDLTVEKGTTNQKLTSQITQQVIDLSPTLKPNVDPIYHLDTTELEKVAQLLANKRIIALGEQTHGAGSVFALKVELIKYLYTHHGFELIVLESGVFEVEALFNMAKQNQSIADNAPGNIFYMYSNTAEVKPLFEFLNQQIPINPELIFAGFDSQHTGSISNQHLVHQLSLALKSSSEDLTLLPQWPQTSHTIQAILNVSRERLELDQEAMFLQTITQIQDLFLSDNNLYWYRISKGLEAQAKRQWSIADTRSAEMGENIKWLAQQYPHKKMIVWAHIGHLSKKAGTGINAGQVIHQAYGDNYFVVHFTGASGSYVDFVDLQVKDITYPQADSLERTLANLNIDVGFVALSDLSIEDQTISAFTFNFGTPVTAPKWQTYWDGIFFINKIKPAS